MKTRQKREPIATEVQAHMADSQNQLLQLLSNQLEAKTKSQKFN